jgi:hypothetical protein
VSIAIIFLIYNLNAHLVKQIQKSGFVTNATQ